MLPQLVKPYVKRGKNDAADAEALCEAMSRPTMRFVPVKSTKEQAALMLVGVRDRLIRNRTQLSNAIRGYAAEFGLTAAKGIAHLTPLFERVQVDESVPALARELFAAQAEDMQSCKPRSGCLTQRYVKRHGLTQKSAETGRFCGFCSPNSRLLFWDGFWGWNANRIPELFIGEVVLSKQVDVPP